MTCPRCESGMRQQSDQGVRLDVCGACGGCWFDRGELETLTRRAEPPEAAHRTLKQIRQDLREMARPVPERKIKYIKCPTCNNMMTRQNFGRSSGVMIDLCIRHGVWLDGGELEHILAFAEKGGLIHARADQVESNAEEAARSGARRVQRMSPRYGYAGRTLGWGLFC